MTKDVAALLINGKRYTGWTEIGIVRGIDRTVSSFHFTAAARSNDPVAQPMDVCEVYADGDKMLTGYVEEITPEIDMRAHTIRVSGHSKTKDLTDCTPDIPSGQFAGFTVAAIARSISALFKIEVDVQTDRAEQVVQNTNLERGETAFRFLERLGNLSGVLLSDDPDGRLVLAVAGGKRSSSRLVQGQNILRGNAHYNSARRFSRYIVKGQSARGGVVQTGMRAEAVDAGVPRYRPHVSLAESQLTPAQMQQRANWQRQYAYGQSIKLHIRVAGWRQADGSLWKPNLIVPVYAPALYVDQDPLIAEVSFNLTPGEGHTTELLLGPVEGYTPDPGSVRAQKDKHAHGHKHKGKATGGNMWSGTGAGGM